MLATVSRRRGLFLLTRITGTRQTVTKLLPNQKIVSAKDAETNTRDACATR
jgi:hypothetical protein